LRNMCTYTWSWR